MALIGIYKITNNINGKFYIGRSVNIRKRWSQHSWPFNWNGIQKDKPLYRAMKKYGLENFSFDIIKYCHSDKELIYSELNAIEKYKPQYNLQHAIDLKVHQAPESIEKIRIAATGRKHSKETIEKLRIASSGVNSFWYGKKGKDHSVYGVKWTKERKEKWILARKKQVMRISDGKIFESINVAAKELHHSDEMIRDHCNKTRKVISKNAEFRFDWVDPKYRLKGNKNGK